MTIPPLTLELGVRYTDQDYVVGVADGLKIARMLDPEAVEPCTPEQLDFYMGRVRIGQEDDGQDTDAVVVYRTNPDSEWWVVIRYGSCVGCAQKMPCATSHLIGPHPAPGGSPAAMCPGANRYPADRLHPIDLDTLT